MGNYYNTSTQAAFVVQIPETAFITNFSMVINGMLYLGKVEEKKESKSFNEAQEEGQSPWQISYHGRDRDRDMDVFEISVNVEANSEVSFALIYQELLERRLSKYVQRFIVQPLQIVPNLSFKASFKESQGFKNFDIKLPQNILNMKGSPISAQIQAFLTTRTVVYTPSVEEERGFNADIGINGKFIVEYDVNQGKDGGVMIIKDDCFIHYVAPKSLQPLAKNIVFLVDVSGSMAGETYNKRKHICWASLTSYDLMMFLTFCMLAVCLSQNKGPVEEKKPLPRQRKRRRTSGVIHSVSGRTDKRLGTTAKSHCSRYCSLFGQYHKPS